MSAMGSRFPNDIVNAFCSMTSDMGKHPETPILPPLAILGMMAVLNLDAALLRRWIVGFR